VVALVGHIAYRGYQRQGAPQNECLTEVDNHTELPLLFFCVVQDRKDLTQGHILGLFRYAILENPAVRAPVACAKNVQSADPVASRRRHAADTGPEPPDNTTYAPLR